MSNSLWKYFKEKLSWSFLKLNEKMSNYSWIPCGYVTPTNKWNIYSANTVTDGCLYRFRMLFENVCLNLTNNSIKPIHKRDVAKSSENRPNISDSGLCSCVPHKLPVELQFANSDCDLNIVVWSLLNKYHYLKQGHIIVI